MNVYKNEYIFEYPTAPYEKYDEFYSSLADQISYPKNFLKYFTLHHLWLPFFYPFQEFIDSIICSGNSEIWETHKFFEHICKCKKTKEFFSWFQNNWNPKGNKKLD